MFKNLQQIRSLYTNCSSLLQSITKQCCTSKKNELKEATVLNKIPDHEAFGVLADDAETLQKILTEKEKDACVQSRLSKEYRTILTHPVNKLDKLNVGLLMEADELKSTCWDEINIEDYACSLANNNSGKCDKEVPKKEHTGSATKANESSSGNTGDTPTPSGKNSSGSDDGSNKVATPGRPVRGEPGKVIYAFIPAEWWEFFMPKTGVTGMATFVFTFGTYLLSKELYVLEHNYYSGLSVLVMVWACIKYLGPQTSKMLDKEIDNYEREFNQHRLDEIHNLEEQIVNEKYVQFQTEGQELLLQAKRENVLLQLEEAFRLRQMYAYEEVKKKLDYQVQAEQVRRTYKQKNLVEYVQREVMKAISPDMQDKMIYYSIDTILRELEKNDKKIK